MISNIYKNEVHAYYLIIPEKFEEFSLKTCAAYLNDDDFVKYSKLRVKGKRTELLLSRVFLWNVLERYLGTKPWLTNFSIRKESNGKPFLFFKNKRFLLFFNLSHTRGLVSCAVSLQHILGIDVEYIDSSKACFIEEYLSQVEKEKLLETHIDKPTYLYALWTLKEAYLKADGCGLSVPLDSFGFTLDLDQKLAGDEKKEAVEIQFSDTGKEQSTEWFFRLYHPTPQHCQAIAVSMKEVPSFRSYAIILDELDSLKKRNF